MRNVFISGISLAGILIFRVLLKMLRLESNKLAMESLVMFFISVSHFPTYKLFWEDLMFTAILIFSNISGT